MLLHASVEIGAAHHDRFFSVRPQQIQLVDLDLESRHLDASTADAEATSIFGFHEFGPIGVASISNELDGRLGGFERRVGAHQLGRVGGGPLAARQRLRGAAVDFGHWEDRIRSLYTI